MTQRERIVEFFRDHDHQATLGQLLDAGFYECRARFTELRRDGYTITVVQDRENPSRNLYTMIEPLQVRFDKNGQMEIAI